MCENGWFSHFLFHAIEIHKEEPVIASKDLVLNERIRAPKVRVVGAAGEQLGILATRDAIGLAYDQGLDLVEIAPGATPPVCRIMDYGKFRFEKEKKLRESRKKQITVELKEVKFSCRIGIHDFNTKISHCHRFLKEGNKVKVTIMFSGREMTQIGNGYAMMERVTQACEDYAVVEKKPSLDGRFMTMYLAPKKEAPKDKEAQPQKEGAAKG